MNRKGWLVVLLIMVASLLTGCLPGHTKYLVEAPAGFLSGIWHGWLAPLSLILSIFTENVRMYETHNVGFLYDLGFYMAIISGFGGLSLNRKRKKHKK